MPVVATAGHVDHGKSTLVHALTGIDPDRWAEEKRRGLTIDLGFAWCTLPGAGDLGFVDVPGHVRFIANMLAGVGAVDCCLFVVDAGEGWKPQSEEHLRILDQLGLAAGVIALTKAAAVSDEHLDLVRLEVADRVAGTFLEFAEVVAVDAPAGFGVDDVAAALDRSLSRAPAAGDRGRPRLWVDRAFAARGAGTVVTGTLAGGGLSVSDDVVIAPGARPARVRGLQSHGRSVDAIGPGWRVAVNLAGIAHDEVSRGDAVVRPAQWFDASILDCSLTVLAGLGHEVTRRGAFHAHIGTDEQPVRVRLLGQSTLAPGSTGLVRLYLARPLPLVPGDRFVLRDAGRSETVGGLEVLDIDPVLPASKARPDRSVDRVVAERGWVAVDDLERLTGERRAPTVGRWAVSPAALAEAVDRVQKADAAQLDERNRAVLATLPARPVDVVDSHPYLDALRAAPFAPPPADGVDRAHLRRLKENGLIVERDGCYFAADAVDQAAAVVAGLLATAPSGVTVAQVRDALGSSRKHVLPLLSHLDATGVTRRRGDLRVAGPRLPAP